ncbi:MNN13 [Candida jiufengensis]|uniref:MNN13 n=1 Tax=Candida jiufengensis TaxID=497108 RepID=UPI0022254D97|nr:MNN13 [Candida jiufengensis]KAI5956253.1 MNN13 [Candida jiufengensis]
MIKLYNNNNKFQKRRITVYTIFSIWIIGMLYWYSHNYYYNNHQIDDFEDHSIYNIYDDHYNPIAHSQELYSNSKSSTTTTIDSNPKSIIDSEETVTETNSETTSETFELGPTDFEDPTDYSNYKFKQAESKAYKKVIEEYEKEQYQKNLKDFRYNNTFYESIKENSNLTKQFDPYSSIYDSIFKDHSMMSIMNDLNFNERCDLFFKHIFLKDQNWNFNPHEDYNVHEDGRLDEFKANNFRLLKYKYSLKEGRDIFEIDDHDDGFKNYMKDEYRAKMQTDNELKIIDNLSILRIYNKCYVTNDETNQQKQTQKFINDQKEFIKDFNEESYLYETKENDKIYDNNEKFELNKFEKLISEENIGNKFQHRLYPWLSFETPVFERWTGQIFNHPPNFRKILKDYSQPINKNSKTSSTNFYSEDSKDFHKSSTNFFKNFKNECNGKGLVLSVADKHVDYVVNLIHLLRALNNKLPIQIVYFNDLNEETKKKIVTAARETFSHLPTSFQKVSELFPEDYLDPKYKGLPKQEVWFVNTANVINENFKNKFHGFANKLLATLFNSFNEYMLLDADTVMMQPPEFFFNLEGYQNTGTFFFKDRGVFQRRTMEDGYFFHRIAPSTIDSLMFNIPIITNYTLGFEVFRGLTHTMESGLVLINREIHFNSIIMINHINLIHSISDKLYGDKELFWLGFAINGDENYHFNKFNAASIGSLTPMGERVRPDGTNHHSKELCSPHPGHINEEDDHSLLWINSGFRYCHQSPRINFEQECKIGERLKFLKPEPNVFKEYYYNPLKIKNAIIPPMDTELLDHPNNQDEPASGWIMDGNYCSSYLWCAYSSVGGTTNNNDDNTMEGILISFNSVERALFDYYGDIWIGME